MNTTGSRVHLLETAKSSKTNKKYRLVPGLAGSASAAIRGARRRFRTHVRVDTRKRSSRSSRWRQEPESTLQKKLLNKLADYAKVPNKIYPPYSVNIFPYIGFIWRIFTEYAWI